MPVARLLCANQVVAVERKLAGIFRSTHHHRSQEHHQVGARFGAAFAAEKCANARDVTQQRDFRFVVGELVFDQTTQHQDGTVIHDHSGFDRAFVGGGPCVAGAGRDFVAQARRLLKNR
jgi:hypothetical protein